MFKIDDMLKVIENEITLKPKFVVRLYIIEAFNLSSRDLTSPSDPYLYIQLGDTIIDERDKHQDDTENPKFYSTYEFKVDLVSTPLLKIKVFDYDYIGKDLIGETVINLDDRYYSPFWRSMPQKPIESRSLYSEETSTERGRLRLWVDIFKAGEETPAWNITPQPDAEFELRLVIWETLDIACFDVEETSDVFIRGFVDPNKDQHTDTHFRCQNGKASFNWRLIMPLTLSVSRVNNALTIQAWDKDIFSKNDYIGSCALDLSRIFKDAFENNRSICWDENYHKLTFGKEPNINIKFDDPEPEGKYKRKFWIPMKSKDKDNPDVLKEQGSVLISLDLLTKADALRRPAGKGREDPNVDPYLPPPVGRIKFSLNPFTMLNQLVGPGVRCKVYCCLCICCAMILFLLIGPSFLAALIRG